MGLTHTQWEQKRKPLQLPKLQKTKHQAMLWYAVHSRPKQEQRALENLQNQGYEAWLPMITLEKLRRGRVTEVVEPMFSRYLFIRLDMEHTNWTPIRSTLGVSR
ncbi:MAG: transcriptional activator RfaH, partial [Betaproteobacteria bacterium]|nr:transcriptional activator RfaH [Betaproteobacteria bacterium]